MDRDSLKAAARASAREWLLREPASGYDPAGSSVPDKLAAIRAAVGAFERCSTSYALIGGLAVGVHTGVPRATLDVDFAIPTQADRDLLERTLSACGFSLVGRFAHSVHFRHESGEPVQLAFDPMFDAMVARAESLDLGELSLRVVGKADLIAMKRRACADPNRRRSKALRDQADLALLEGDVPDPNEGW